MQLNIYLLRHFFKASLLVLASLLAVIWLNHALRMLEFVVNKGALLLDFVMLSLFPFSLWIIIALPISGFIGVLWVICKFLSDRELVVMQAIGISPSQFARMPIVFGICLTALLYLNSIYFLPTSFTKFKQIQASVRTSIPELLIQDNIFIDIADGLTLFVGERISSNEVGQVFIQDNRISDTIITFTSQKGQFTHDNGNPVLLLSNGQRTELKRDGESSAQLSFDTHRLDISQQILNPEERDVLDVNEETILNLLDPTKAQSPLYARERMAMGHYRLASPLLALSLCLLATAIMLQGRILRETMNRRIMIAALAGILVLTLLILARGIALKTPSLWPLIYLSVVLPMGLSLFILWNPFFISRVSAAISKTILFHQPKRRP